MIGGRTSLNVLPNLIGVLSKMKVECLPEHRLGTRQTTFGVDRQYFRMRQFIEKLGFDPYPGTLNLRLLTEYDRIARQEIAEYPSIYINGFEDESRTFGPVRCYRALVNNKAEGAILVAGRTHYDKSVVEIISTEYLRDHLNLKDGSKVKVEIYFKRDT